MRKLMVAALLTGMASMAAGQATVTETKFDDAAVVYGQPTE